MKMLTWFLVTVIPPLLASEFTELSPWLARKVVKTGAHLLLERDQVLRYEEEWLAGLEETPGKITVLLRAMGIVLIAVPQMNWDYLDCLWSCTVGLRSFTWNARSQLRWPLYEQINLDEEKRLAARRYNATLNTICQTLRQGSPTKRAEALELLDYLVENPPPWITAHRFDALMLKWMIARDLPHLRQSLRRRGLIAPLESESR